MKKIALFATALFLSVAVMAQTKVDDVAKFPTESHSFGKIKHNVPVTYFFEIKNISDKPLVVENTSASCGCTVPEKPEQPINPGQSAKIKVVYNAAALGPVSKDVYVKFAGIEQPKTLHISGEVLSVEAFDALPKAKTKGK
jgi:Protein of unknown function (DUF1573)